MQETRELTLEELDHELAEQLPPRDLMCYYDPCHHWCGPTIVVFVAVKL